MTNGTLHDIKTLKSKTHYRDIILYYRIKMKKVTVTDYLDKKM